MALKREAFKHENEVRLLVCLQGYHAIVTLSRAMCIIEGFSDIGLDHLDGGLKRPRHWPCFFVQVALGERNIYVLIFFKLTHGSIQTLLGFMSLILCCLEIRYADFIFNVPFEVNA